VDRGTPVPLCSPGQLDNAEREGDKGGEGGRRERDQGEGRKREGMTTMMEYEVADNRICRHLLMPFGALTSEMLQGEQNSPPQSVSVSCELTTPSKHVASRGCWCGWVVRGGC